MEAYRRFFQIGDEFFLISAEFGWETRARGRPQLAPLSERKVRAKHRLTDQSQGNAVIERRVPVHFPVPFCPAVSRILSTNGIPSSSLKVRISRVISIR